MKLVEHLTTLQAPLTQFVQNAEKIKKAREYLTSQFKQTLTHNMDSFKDSLNKAEKDAEKRHREHSRLVEARANANRLRAVEGGSRARDAEQQVDLATQIMSTADRNLNLELSVFEYERVRFQNEKLQRLIRALLAYHSNCVSFYTAALQDFRNVDPLADAQSLCQHLVREDAKAEGIHPDLAAAREAEMMGALKQAITSRQYVKHKHTLGMNLDFGPNINNGFNTAFNKDGASPAVPPRAVPLPTGGPYYSTSTSTSAAGVQQQQYYQQQQQQQPQSQGYSHHNAPGALPQYDPRFSG